MVAGPNADIKVCNEIQADFTNRAQDQTKRAVSESAKTLNFGTAEWEGRIGGDGEVNQSLSSFYWKPRIKRVWTRAVSKGRVVSLVVKTPNNKLSKSINC